jgi:hypothetical protein
MSVPNITPFLPPESVMGATASSVLSASNWASIKPAAYKGGQDLASALTTYESVPKTGITVPKDFLPSKPMVSIKEVDDCIATMKRGITDLEKGKATINKVVSALQAVQTAASKTSADLTKLSKSPNVDTTVYQNAATQCNGIGSAAADALKKVQ